MQRTNSVQDLEMDQHVGRNEEIFDNFAGVSYFRRKERIFADVA